MKFEQRRAFLWKTSQATSALLLFWVAGIGLLGALFDGPGEATMICLAGFLAAFISTARWRRRFEAHLRWAKEVAKARADGDLVSELGLLADPRAECPRPWPRWWWRLWGLE